MSRRAAGVGLASVAFGAVLCLFGRIAAADSLADGVTDYAYKDWPNCIAHLRAVLYPPILLEAEAKKAREVLAACYFNKWVDGKMSNAADREAAERESKALLFENKDYKIVAVDDRGFKKFFDDVRGKYIDELRAYTEKEKREKAEAEAILRAKIREEFEALYASKEPMVFKIVRSRERDLKVAHFIPVYGQLYNKDYAAAAIFGLSTSALVFTSLYTFAGLHSWLRDDCTTAPGATITNRWNCPPNYSSSNFALARAYRAVNVLSTVSAGVVLAAGILHAAIRGRDVGEVTREMTTAEKIRLGIWKPPGDFAPPLPGTAGDDAEKTAPAKKDVEPPKGSRDLDPGLYLVPFEAPADAGASFGLGLELHF